MTHTCAPARQKYLPRRWRTDKRRGCHRTATSPVRSSLSIAISRSFGLSCQSGVAAPGGLVALDRKVGPGESAESAITPASSSLVLGGIYNIRASFWDSLHNLRHRTASSKHAANEIQCADACGFRSCARLPWLAADSRELFSVSCVSVSGICRCPVA